MIPVSAKLFEPDSFLKASNSMLLKFGLFNCFHNPQNSIALLVIDLFTTTFSSNTDTTPPYT